MFVTCQSVSQVRRQQQQQQQQVRCSSLMNSATSHHLSQFTAATAALGCSETKSHEGNISSNLQTLFFEMLPEKETAFNAGTEVTLVPLNSSNGRESNNLSG